MNPRAGWRRRAASAILAGTYAPPIPESGAHPDCRHERGPSRDSAQGAHESAGHADLFFSPALREIDMTTHEAVTYCDDAARELDVGPLKREDLAPA
ncbi:hypothetical protein [Nannocystis punicea]|uniref:Uncharacterized protein n=1 Tax=Nannocystis punicea TaxID=2995304 RepID=A0ABY7HBU2_9BACT|nr:hypothetical protein [Nannocystis poenicansa]WAS96743.1 hypothetical protein O0S08_11390 [Nannocystis poenicansa]